MGKRKYYFLQETRHSSFGMIIIILLSFLIILIAIYNTFIIFKIRENVNTDALLSQTHGKNDKRKK